MVKKYSQLIIGILFGLLVGLLIAKKVFINSANTTTNNTVHNNNENTRRAETDKEVKPDVENINKAIPAKVYTVLEYIKANSSAMDGYVGGRVFSNREGNLPRQDAQGNNINYQEWDVNKKIKGQNRGTERICTGSDGRSWYTNDHYRSFTQIK
jgi:ribonuclease T1